MTWQIALLLSSILGIVRDTFTKKITQHINPLVALFYFYITAVIASSLLALLYFQSNPFGVTALHWWARVFGLGFGVGVYGLFSAIKINLTKTQAFLSYRNLISIVLAAVFFNELSHITWKLGIATILFLLSLVLPQVLAKRKSAHAEDANKEWLFWMILHLVFIGSGMFLAKLFTHYLTPIDLLVNQYLGSFVMIVLILVVRQYYTSGEARKVFSLAVANHRILALTLFNGFVTAISIFLLYLALAGGQVTVVTQVDNFLRILIIIPIGMFVFKETKQLTRIDYLSIALALIGAALLMS